MAVGGAINECCSACIDENLQAGATYLWIRFISYDNETDRNGGLLVAIDLGLDPV